MPISILKINNKRIDQQKMRGSDDMILLLYASFER
jgi:hypothetical protein